MCWARMIAVVFFNLYISVDQQKGARRAALMGRARGAKGQNSWRRRRRSGLGWRPCQLEGFKRGSWQRGWGERSERVRVGERRKRGRQGNRGGPQAP